MAKKLVVLVVCLFIKYSVNAQNNFNKEQVAEILQLISHFQGTKSSFFQTKKAQDSLIYLLNNKAHQNNSETKNIDVQKVYFNRALLSLELFFSADQIESYVFDSLYRSVPFLKKIYTLYLNYPSKNINSFSSQEGVALMYQVELYLFFNDTPLYVNNLKAIVDTVDGIYAKKKVSKK